MCRGDKERRRLRQTFGLRVEEGMDQNTTGGCPFRIVQEGALSPRFSQIELALPQNREAGYTRHLAWGISRHSISTAETPLAPRLIHQTRRARKKKSLLGFWHPLTNPKEGSKKGQDIKKNQWKIEKKTGAITHDDSMRNIIQHLKPSQLD